MKQLALAISALCLLAAGFGIGWASRGSYAPVVTVQMAPAERAYFMPPVAQLPADNPCRIAGELKGAGKPVPVSLENRCDASIAASLDGAIRLSNPRTAHK